MDISGTCGDVDAGDTIDITATKLGDSSLPFWLAFSGADIFSGTPTSTGSFSISVVCTDNHGAAASQTFVITVTGNAPPIYTTPIPDVVYSVGQVINIIGANPFTDADNVTALTCVAGLAGGASLPAALIAFTNTNSIDFGPGTSATIDATFANNTYTIKIDCSDEVTTTTGTFKMTITDVPAVPNPIGGTKIIIIGQVHSFTMPGHTFSDYEDLTYTAAGLPAGITFNAATQEFSGTPTTAGTTLVTITATDVYGYSNTDTFSYTVRANTAPTLTLPNIVVDVGGAVSYTIVSTDAEGDAVTHTVTDNPAFTTFADPTITNNIVVAVAHAGNYSISVTACDIFSACTTQSFNLRINQIPSL